MMRTIKVVISRTRLHVTYGDGSGCWCNPRTDEDSHIVYHRCVDIAVSPEYKMSAYTEVQGDARH